MPYATADATRRYAESRAFSANGFYRSFNDLTVSSLGLGTYLGRPDANDDVLYTEAIRLALKGGINLLDAAINYRCMRSERNIGAAIRSLVAEGLLKREETVVCTKGGYLPFDGGTPLDPAAQFRKDYVENGILTPTDVAAGCHSMAPAFLMNQVGRSLTNLGLDSIDLYYVHNPETQFEEVDRDTFDKRLQAAFAALEECADQGKIQTYGVATWNGFRLPPDEIGHLSLEGVLRCAERAGGSRHRFRAIQLPINLAMPEAYLLPTQTKGSQTLTLLEAARSYHITVIASAPMLQGRLATALPETVRQALAGLPSDAVRALQFARSLPGVTATLAGMKKTDHVAENLSLTGVPPAPPEILGKGLFSME